MKQKISRAVFGAAIAATGVAAQAADWSDLSMGYRYGETYREPYNPEKISKNILHFTYVSGSQAGSDFLNVDLLMSDTKDSPDKQGHAREVYAVYRHTFDLAHLTGISFQSGPLRGVGLTAGLDLNSKSGDSYQSKKRMLVAGPTLQLDVPGFLNISLLALRESNAPAAHRERYTYKTHPMLNINWGIPLGTLPLSFEGYANFIDAKGKDEFGAETRPETNIDAQVMWDAGSAMGMRKNSFRLGVQYQYWKNKFGNDSSKDTSGGSTARTPMIRAEYHF